MRGKARDRAAGEDRKLRSWKWEGRRAQRGEADLDEGGEAQIGMVGITGKPGNSLARNLNQRPASQGRKPSGFSITTKEVA